MKIAVIGCSHSDPRCIDYQMLEVGPQRKTWVCHVAENRSDLIVDNYSFGAHGLQYVDFILKKILAGNIKYDAVILQLTDTHRTLVPLADYNDKMKWVSYYISENYRSIIKMSPTASVLANSVFAQEQTEKVISKSWLRENVTGNCFIDEFVDYFKKTLFLYENVFDRFYYFSMCGDGKGSNFNNLGITDKPNAYRYLSEKYGDEILTDDLHLKDEHSHLIVTDYLQDTELGDFLNYDSIHI